ncbi:hypothetical protein GLOIN_2v1786118 [Rhizophagus irregularis DAOM 181602=DAOM 197198]|nr:hypothetical protein GLOIN_2v1786118 [Rhizophagus irregularis DAOM 181602=DAOM 197198]
MTNVSKAEINDLCEKLLAKNSEYSRREKGFHQIHADVENKISQLNASTTEIRSEFISEWRSRIELEVEVKSLKSNIKTLKREATLAQKASSADKVQILSLETKIRELEDSGRLDNGNRNEPERQTFDDGVRNEPECRMKLRPGLW